MTHEIWVVDDNQALTQALCLLFQTQGLYGEPFTTQWDVFYAIDVEKRLPSVMVLDLNMPGNGETVLGRIFREKEWTFPLVIVTGYEDTLDPKYIPRVLKVFSKTFVPLELVACLKEALGRAKGSNVPCEG